MSLLNYGTAAGPGSFGLGVKRGCVLVWVGHQLEMSGKQVDT